MLLFLFLLIWSLAALPVDSAPAVTAQIDLGFGGIVVPDAWIPLAVTLKSNAALTGLLEVTTTGRRPAIVERVRRPIGLLPQSIARIIVPVVVRDPRAPITVRLLANGSAHQPKANRLEEVGEWTATPGPSQISEEIVLVLTRRPAGLQRFLDPSRRRRVAYARAEDLPPWWQAYEGVRVIVVDDLDLRRVTPDQVNALLGWLAAGGRMAMVGAGDEGMEAFRHIARQSRWASRADALRPRPMDSLGAPYLGSRAFTWGQGAVMVVAADPFETNLSPSAQETWRHVLADSPTPSIVDNTLLDIIPAGPGPGRILHLLIAFNLAAYLLFLGPIARWAAGQRGAKVLAIGVLTVFVGVATVLGKTARYDMSGLVQAAVADVAPDLGMARVEAYGQVAVPDGFVRLNVQDGALMRALGTGELTMELGTPRRAEVRSVSRIVPVRTSALTPLDVAGTYRSGAGLQVEVENRTGGVLRDGLIALNGRVQPIPEIGSRLSVTLPEFGWRDSPAREHARGLAERTSAWVLSRLPHDAIITPTVYLVAWLHDGPSRQIISGRPAPLLVIIPLSRVDELR